MSPRTRRWSAAASALLLSATTPPSSHASAFAPPRRVASPRPPTRLRDAEDLASALDVVDRPSSSSPSDVVVNGTPERVRQNPLGKFADACSAAAFGALHFDDDTGIKDSSKNLRVLWSRSYLDRCGALEDDVARRLLPPSTRDVVNLLPTTGPLVDFQEFITSRTKFIDGAVDDFLRANVEAQDSSGSSSKPQIVLFGAGYDTRSLRYHGKADFYEVDLPDVVEGKGRLHRKWRKLEKKHDARLPARIAYDLNDAADPTKPSLTASLAAAGLDPDVPTLYVWEAVLFYVKPAAVRAIFDDVFSNGGSDAIYCLTDSLKPAVTTSFLHVVREFFGEYGLEVIDHNSRWGGAVHFALAGRPASSGDFSLAESMRETRPALPHSYLAASREGGVESQSYEAASFDEHWYAVAYPWMIQEKEVYATSLWGEPLVLYRDVDGNLVCAKDACPHRSAPLSMSKINEEGRLECMYHGWAYGKGGACENIPTQAVAGAVSNKTYKKKACLKTYAVQEHEGLIWVWRGHVLSADASKLPVTRTDASTYPIDTVLDYNVDWQYIVENNLDSPHLFYLHNGSVPPVRSLNFVRDKIAEVTLQSFKDDSGRGHYGRTAGGKPKIVRFDAPNVVRHGGASSFSEEFHIVPIAPGRTRVLLRQNLPKGPILSTALKVPSAEKLLTKLVNVWNYHIALEDYSVMQGQAHNCDDLGAPHLAVGDLGDDLVAHFYKWKGAAEENDGSLPFFSRWDGNGLAFKAATDEREVSRDTTFGVVDDGQRVDGRDVGTYGILKSYSQSTPVEKYPPVNYGVYKPLLDLDQMMRRDAPGNEVDEEENSRLVAAGAMATTLVGTATVGVAMARAMESVQGSTDLPQILVALNKFL
ncbi:hypothetical protein ACHAWF_017544 [Thalassiosira exigua]